MNELLSNPAVASALGTIAALLLAAGVKALHRLVSKTETKLDDKVYDAVTKAFKENS